MHTLKLLLKTTKEDDIFIESVYRAVADVHNILVSEGKKRLRMLSRDKRYQYAKTHYGEAAAEVQKLEQKIAALEAKIGGCQDDLSKKDLRKKLKPLKADRKQAEDARKRFSAELEESRNKYGTSENSMETFATRLNQKYKGILNSQQIQIEADRVWSGMSKVIFGDGKDIHYKKYRDFRTVCGKQNTTGIRFLKDILFVSWLGHTIPIAYRKKLDDAAVNGTKNRDLAYKLASLSGEIKYCEILREEFKDGYHYYANLYIDGEAPKKLTSGKGRCGLDPGVSTLAVTAEKKIFLEELAPDYKKYDKAIFKLQRQADTLRRELNPQNYAEDGTVIRMKPGQKRIWHTSLLYEKIMQEIRVLYRKKSAYIRQSHSGLCNKLLAYSDVFLIEGMDFAALAKKAKETSRSQKKSVVTMADGTKKEIHKFKRKKRFGKSVNSRAPAIIIQILKRKCVQYGLVAQTTDTRTMKASQYDHTSGECTKHTLNDREVVLSDGTHVQRDLYSSFLHQHADAELKHPDREACIRDFPAFMRMHDQLIAEMKVSGVSMKQCFGF